jgi:hypothetical protein
MFRQHNGIIRRDIQKSNFNLKIKLKKLLLEYYLDSLALVLENNKLRLSRAPRFIFIFRILQDMILTQSTLADKSFKYVAKFK